MPMPPLTPPLAPLLKTATRPARKGLPRAGASAQGPEDRYISSARPTFLYVIYAILLWSIPIGLIGALSPTAARNMVAAMTAYFAGLPEPLYTLFGAAYLGYTAARQFGKAGGRLASRSSTDKSSAG
jgi:hypothetical protein